MMQLGGQQPLEVLFQREACLSASGSLRGHFRKGRQVCRVRSGSSDLGDASLLEAGLAWHYMRFAKEQPADERARYARLESTAREDKVGIWGDPDPMQPEVCRKARRAGEKCR